MIDAAGLRVIRAIADEGSFTAAASSLGYSQPAISQMVRRLEERLGTPLVERLGRNVRLTEAGEVLARHAGAVLGAISAAESEVAAIAGLKSGRVRLMAFPSSSSTLVPKALSLVKKRFPQVQVSFAEGEPPESLAALRAGECDVAVAFTYDGLEISSDHLDDFEVKELLLDHVRIALPLDHPLAAQDSVDLAALAEAPWIAGCPRCRGHLLSLAAAAGYRPDVAFETEDYVAVLGLVAEGLGVALVPDLILRSAPNARVKVLPIDPPSHRTVYAVTTPDLTRVPAVAAMIDALMEAAGDSSCVGDLAKQPV